MTSSCLTSPIADPSPQGEPVSNVQFLLYGSDAAAIKCAQPAADLPGTEIISSFHLIDLLQLIPSWAGLCALSRLMRAAPLP